MSAAEIHRLRAEVASDLAACRARLAELEPLEPLQGDAAVLAQTAVALHHAYGAIEAALARVARLLEGSVPQAADWHQQLLHTMTLAIPSVRPAVLSGPSASALRRLLAFRRFFRHAYATEWDARQLADLREQALALRAPLEKDFAALDAFLLATAEALAE